jgi:O-antigen/teichoic acid export membrane protein
MIQEARRLLRRKFVQDTITLQIGKIGVMILGLLAWIIVPLRLGPHDYGLFALAQSFLGIWQVLNLTGIDTSTGVLLSTAIGARNEDEILDLLAVFVKVTLIWAALSVLVLMFFGPTIAAYFYRDPVPPAAAQALSFPLLAGLETTGNGEVGVLAGFLALILFTDPLFNLVLTVFRSRRNMRLFALLQNLNQLVLTICLVSAAFISPTPGGQVIGRLVYTSVTLLIALWVYRRYRVADPISFPTLGAVAQRALTVSYAPYWRFGFANAVDKNLAGIYINIPLQLVGIIAGPAAASYIQLGLRGLNRASFFTSSIFENMQAVIPQAIGRHDYVSLRANFMRVLTVLSLGGLFFYAAIIVLAPLVIVPIFGEEWIPILPLLPAFCIYGLATTIGGVFGPLYRAFDLMRAALLIKFLSLALCLLPGWWLIQQMDALGGVWMINLLFVISIALTALVTLSALRQAAETGTKVHEPA